MHVDGVDIGRRETCGHETTLPSPIVRRVPRGVARSDGIVGRGSNGQDLGVDPRTASHSVLQRFENERAGPFREDESVAVRVEGAACSRR